MLLALAREDSLASRALAQAGATYEALRRFLAEIDPDPDLGPLPRWHDGARFTPRLERLAAAFDEDVPPERWLVAVLAEPVSLAASALEHVGQGREAVAAALRELGVDVRELPPEPEWVRLPRGEPIYIPGDRLMDVVRVASREVDVGFGFNWTRDGRGRVCAPRDVDLQSIVDRVLAE